MKILLTGGTGLVGTELIKQLLDKGYEIHVLTRFSKENTNQIKYFEWNIEKNEIDDKALDGVESIIHLAGAGITDKKWSKKRKIELIESRVKSTELILKICIEKNIKIKNFISAGGIGYYQSAFFDGPICDENSPKGNDFVAEICEKWENAAQKFEKIAEKIVILRTGVVLSKKGGFLQKFTAPIKFKIAGVFGKGRQDLSWIHIKDLCNIYLESINNSNLIGVYNASICNDDTSLSFIKTYLKVFKKKAIIVKTPNFVAKLIFGEMSVLVTKGVKAPNTKLINDGFQFEYPYLEEALENLKG